MAFDLIQFTDQLRYLPYRDWSKEYQQKLVEKVATSPWRATYHTETPTGLLNDPNGFSYFNGKWQLFYQYYPFGPVHGLKSWFRLTSEDLFHWERQGIALEADTAFDSHGAYSGSAIATDKGLFAFYTGNVRDKDWVRTPYQNGAWMDTNGCIEKLEKPLITPPDFVTDHFRDPNIFYYEGIYYALFGAQLKETLKGAILLYRCEVDTLDDWRYIGKLDIGETELGYMVECPAITFVDNHPVLLFCPQGLSKTIDDYHNIYPNKYIVGEAFDPDNARIVNPSAMRNVDEGFDYYAATTANGAHDEALTVAWIGLPEIAYPTDDYGYQGALTMVRELSLREGQLYQTPIIPKTTLGEEIVIKDKGDLGHNHYHLSSSIPFGEKTTLRFFTGVEDNQALTLTIEENGAVTLDRSKTPDSVGEDYGMTRTTRLRKQEYIQVDAYIDESIIEIFFNQGEKVMTARYFPKKGHTGVEVANAKIREIKR